ncbi:MAG: fumarylacetoacetate hydrolase family protein [Vulcanimicrobiaceae bacterium]|jgi:2-keto-4-pentenoate hydratase/2-oxohepta-3-ene-1,7-dioic acid hydratase in catechol pathway
MRIVSYRVGGGSWRAGAERDGSVIDIAGDGDPSVKALLSGGKAALDAAAAREKSGKPVSGNVEIGPVIPDPDKIICIGLNYRKHAEETGQPLPTVPTMFPKYRNALIANGAQIVLPRNNPDNVDYENELTIIIGKRCKYVTESEALDYVAGYTIMNDVSARDLQMQTSQWGAGKAVDTFAPLGPALVPASEIGNPQKLAIKTRLNGKVVQDSNTSDMVFTCAQIVAFLSNFMTLEPGDVIATGTPEGVGFKRNPPLFLKDGDIIELEIEKLGILRNPVVSKVPAAV